MKIVQLIQGTPEWHAHRAQHLNASDAPAMMGCSPYKTRAQLVREVATGIGQDIDADRQRIFDAGHRYEALARPLAEQIVGEDLFPVTGTDGKYSASFDGLTLLEDTAFEHKSLNDTLRGCMRDQGNGWDLPQHYRVQMEHQMLVSGAERVLFMASKWNADDTLVEARHCWYYPDAALRARLVAGWEQFEADVAAYESAPATVAEAVGRRPDQMPALLIEVTGMVTETNLAEWRKGALEFFGGINQTLVTDQDFADAEQNVKACSLIEDQLKGAKQNALSKTASIDELFRTIDAISETARATRLALEKLVKARKDERRTEIGNTARRAVLAHVQAINETLGQHAVQAPATLVADIAEAMKGKRSFSSMQEAVEAVAANAKVAVSQFADRVRANIAILEGHSDYATLFADRVQLCASKAPEDLRNLAAARIAEHEKAEQERLETEREKIRQEELDRIERERQEAEAQERQRIADEARQVAQAAAQQVPAAPTPTAVVESAAAPAPVPAIAPRRVKLGDINAWIAPLSITADGLAKLGLKEVGAERAAKLYDAAQLPAMWEAMKSVLVGAPARASEKAAA